MYDQAIMFLSFTYFIIGSISGLIISIACKSKLKKVGGAFVGGVSGIISGLIFVISVTNLKAKLAEANLGLSLGDLVPGLIVALLFSIFVVYILSFISNK